MLDTQLLAVDGGQITVLDEQTLASLGGGDGFKDWLIKKVGELLFDCIAGGLDDLIAAAEEGYTDAR